MRTTTQCLLLAAALVAVACADSPDIDPNCRIHDRRLKTVVACVKRNGGVAIIDKLNAARGRLRCPDIECGVRKFCKINKGTLSEEEAIIRGLFATCREES
ncbi:uncharacterized protein LOC144101719 isoform X2 [Amblyomma americanum]